MPSPKKCLLIFAHSWKASCEVCGWIETFPKKPSYAFYFDNCCPKCSSHDYVLSRVADENPSPKIYSVPLHMLEIPAVLRRLRE